MESRQEDNLSWKEISEKFANLPPHLVRELYDEERKRGVTPKSLEGEPRPLSGLTPDESEKLANLGAGKKILNWTTVAETFPDRSALVLRALDEGSRCGVARLEPSKPLLLHSLTPEGAQAVDKLADARCAALNCARLCRCRTQLFTSWSSVKISQDASI